MIEGVAEADPQQVVSETGLAGEDDEPFGAG
jgi:hypothetical protein